MPVIVWIFGSLMVAAIAAAFAFALQLAETKRRLQHAENDLTIALSEKSALNKKHDQEKADIQTMTNARINELTQTISNLQPAVETKTSEPSHADLPLDESKMNILQFLSRQQYPIQQYDIEQFMRLPTQVLLFHIEELATKTNLLECSRSWEGVPLFALSQEGRRYLIERELL